ncbi:peptide chain release factor N(5)-glutamine methyltransferase [Aurantiacibacter poecillastricola]|uniref:peptide chain release factor N(5)-glutamine methyltransferase n=1 Tax=Aurantiacibacter poecillastricola TaxID=3064385 RepID=UPI00273D6EAC|nr:peptide chain release factor N(5)-glutamine methyltransferase [Aurantiacibacter sp. 219JJ12-13]MDP5260226.1 peptide chain release factor N(5)-glutamine methyltransferase [Aurantiacibacter sp. 219JJ12-13]
MKGSPSTGSGRSGVEVSEAIREAAQRLAATSDTARLDAELLMAHALGVSRSDVLLRRMQDDAPGTYAALVERRGAREPVAYITGRQEFFGLDFEVSPDVLIPRGDSETIVRAALETAPGARRVLDLGTGSGALLLAVLSELPAASGVGVDASSAALEVARRNAEALELASRARMQERDWTMTGWADDLGQFDLILANPPYVEDAAALDPDVRDYEPASALFAGPEGLDDYRILIPQLPQLLSEGGIAVLEIGASQAQAVGEIARAHGFAASAHTDLGGRDRALVLRLRVGKGDSSS